MVVALLCLGCRAKTPTKAETQIVDWTKLHITIGGRNDINPLKPTPENIADGKQNFTSYCMICHGLDGQKPASHLLPPCRPRSRLSPAPRCRLTQTDS